MHVDDFYLDIEDAPAGAVLCYAESVSSLKHNRAAKIALRAYYEGKVELLQQRQTGPHSDGTPGKFSYFAIKRKDVRPPRVPIYLREMVDRILGIKRAEDEA